MDTPNAVTPRLRYVAMLLTALADDGGFWVGNDDDGYRRADLDDYLAQAEHALKVVDSGRDMVEAIPLGDRDEAALLLLLTVRNDLEAYIRGDHVPSRDERPEGPDADVARACAHNLRRHVERLEGLADEIEATKQLAAERWLTHSEIVKVMAMNPAQLTQLCNAGTIRCIGKGKARKIDANSVLRYMLSRMDPQDGRESDDEVEKKMRDVGL